MVFIGNLMVRHPSCAVLAHHPDCTLDKDPFRADVDDPAKTCAMDSSLWEIKVCLAWLWLFHRGKMAIDHHCPTFQTLEIHWCLILRTAESPLSNFEDCRITPYTIFRTAESMLSHFEGCRITLCPILRTVESPLSHFEDCRISIVPFWGLQIHSLPHFKDYKIAFTPFQRLQNHLSH